MINKLVQQETMTKKLAKWTAGVAIACLVSPVSLALQINDPGVVGIVDYDRANANVTTRTIFANYLLSLGANVTGLESDQNTNGEDESYSTSSTDYNAVLSGGVDAGFLLDVSAYEWVMAKYNGKNAGYVLFNVADAGGVIPEFSNPLWGTVGTGQYQLSGVTGFGSNVPDGGTTVALFGLSLLGLGGVRRLGRSRKA